MRLENSPDLSTFPSIFTSSFVRHRSWLLCEFGYHSIAQFRVGISYLCANKHEPRGNSVALDKLVTHWSVHARLLTILITNARYKNGQWPYVSGGPYQLRHSTRWKFISVWRRCLPEKKPATASILLLLIRDHLLFPYPQTRDTAAGMVFFFDSWLKLRPLILIPAH